MTDMLHVVCPHCDAVKRAILKNGREVARQSGAMDAGRLQGWIESSL